MKAKRTPSRPKRAAKSATQAGTSVFYWPNADGSRSSQRLPAIDRISLDIVENALRNARNEMDAVLFRSAMSPVIR